ncbi:MAG: hypothetical protein ACXABI_17390, partial [Candidatus Hodarchaeales archaeon]
MKTKFIKVSSIFVLLLTSLNLAILNSQATTTIWELPDIVADVGWSSENNIKYDNDSGAYAHLSDEGNNYYIEGSDFDLLSEAKIITTTYTKVRAKHNGRWFQSAPQIKIGIYYESEWHWSGPLTLSTSWVDKQVNFYTDYAIDEEKVRIYVSSNPDSVKVQIDYLKCKIEYEDLIEPFDISNPENATVPTGGFTDPGNLGSDWGRHPT